MAPKADFQDSINIYCLGTAEQVKGLQWSLEHDLYSNRQFKVFRGNLEDLPLQIPQYDFVVVFTDLGQPLPIETLKKFIGTRSGLCVFVQPTPGQLLAASQLRSWTSMAWDQSNYPDVSRTIDSWISEEESRIRQSAFIDSARDWLKTSTELVARIQFINAPDNFLGPKELSILPAKKLFSVGMISSGADWCLPVPGQDIIFELFLNSYGTWAFRQKSQKLPVEMHGSDVHLKPGDQIQVGEWSFLLKMDGEVEKLYSVAQKFSVFESSLFNSPSQAITLSEMVREVLYAHRSGELQVGSKQKRGVIYFRNGTIFSAVCGAVSGVKALQRMIQWEDAQWKFVDDRQEEAPAILGQMRMDLTQFARMSYKIDVTWQKLKAFVPPPGLTLAVNGEAFQKKENWTVEEFAVFAGVAEYRLVRDIVNYCPLLDAEIYNTLITLRKQGLLIPVKK